MVVFEQEEEEGRGMKEQQRKIRASGWMSCSSAKIRQPAARRSGACHVFPAHLSCDVWWLEASSDLPLDRALLFACCSKWLCSGVRHCPDRFFGWHNRLDTGCQLGMRLYLEWGVWGVDTSMASYF